MTDICIKNMSSRGLMAQSDEPPERGVYVEIRRGAQCVIGRVIWSFGGRFGVRAQDRIDIGAIVNEPRLERRPDPSAAATVPERRRDPRTVSAEERADRSRRISAMFQFATVVALSGGGAVFIALQVYDVLTDALRPVTTHLVP